MAAFAAAYALGFRWIETDVHATADGVLVAFHDPDLDRLTDRTGTIADLPWSEVRKARIGGQAAIPLLHDVLDAWPDLRLAVDPKHDDAVLPLVSAIQERGAHERICVGSFEDDRIAAVAERLGPRVCTGLGPKALSRLSLASIGVPVGSIAGHVAQVPRHIFDVPVIGDRVVAEAHRRGLAVHVWTVNDTSEMDDLLDRGVDGLMTDRPTALRDVLVARSAWHGS